MEQRTAQLDLDHDVASPRAARRFVSATLADWGFPEETLERSQLLVSELVSNAVLHGEGPIKLTISSPGAAVIRVEVSNRGEAQLVNRRAQRDDLSGRGLQLIDDLAIGWGSHTNDGHTVVWFHLGGQR